MVDSISVVIADDHSGFRQALQQVIEAEPDMTVVASVGDGAAALEAIARFKPDIAVLDVSMPGRGGIDIARSLAELQLAVRAVVMTLHWEPAVFERAAAAGASGFLSKETALLEIVAAIRAAARGETYVGVVSVGGLSRLPNESAEPCASSQTTCASSGDRVRSRSYRAGVRQFTLPPPSRKRHGPIASILAWPIPRRWRRSET
jgi:DNA-binding NarL/FixJ family response regulator